MPEYRLLKGKMGMRYSVDGKLTSADKIPKDILEKLIDENKPIKSRRCIFCGNNAEYSRFVNLQTVALCEEDYLNQNIGKIAQRLNQLNKEEENASQEISGSEESQQEQEISKVQADDEQNVSDDAT